MARNGKERKSSIGNNQNIIHSLFHFFFFYVLLLKKKVNVGVLCMMRVTDVEIGLWLKDPLTILFFSFMLRNITVKRKPKVF